MVHQKGRRNSQLIFPFLSRGETRFLVLAQTLMLQIHFFINVLKLFGGGSVINGVYPVYFCLGLYLFQFFTFGVISLLLYGECASLVFQPMIKQALVSNVKRKLWKIPTFKTNVVNILLWLCLQYLGILDIV